MSLLAKFKTTHFHIAIPIEDLYIKLEIISKYKEAEMLFLNCV